MNATFGYFLDLAGARAKAQELADKYGCEMFIVRPGCRPGVSYVDKPMSVSISTAEALGRCSGAIAGSCKPSIS